ncbi:MAG TPA: hypothetical protein VGK56_18665 [Anaerolineales bacterium]
MGSPQGYNRKEVLYRVGTFFILVAIGLLAFFFLSEASRQVVVEYFCWSVALLVVGFFFRGQFKRTAPPSGRFSLVRKLMPKAKKDQEKKK